MVRAVASRAAVPLHPIEAPGRNGEDAEDAGTGRMTALSSGRFPGFRVIVVLRTLPRDRMA